MRDRKRREEREGEMGREERERGGGERREIRRGEGRRKRGEERKILSTWTDNCSQIHQKCCSPHQID